MHRKVHRAGINKATTVKHSTNIKALNNLPYILIIIGIFSVYSVNENCHQAKFFSQDVNESWNSTRNLMI